MDSEKTAADQVPLTLRPDNLKKTKDLLKGLILHQDEIGAEGRELMYFLLAVGIEPSCQDQDHHPGSNRSH